MDTQDLPVIVKFLFGSISGSIATTVSYPFDVAKILLQANGIDHRSKDFTNTYNLLRIIAKNEGLISFSNALGPSIARQKIYSGMKTGVYQNLVDLYSKKMETSPPFLTKVVCAMLSGVAAGFFSQPSDLIATRIITAPINERLKSSSMFQTFKEVINVEGIRGLYKAGSVTVLRSMVATVTSFVTYAEVKEFFIRRSKTKRSQIDVEENIGYHLLCSVASTFCMVLLFLPFDTVKVRLQYMRIISGVPKYRGTVDCFRRIIGNEGFRALWKGFTPAFLSYGPFNAVFFVFYENLLRMYKGSMMEIQEDDKEFIESEI